ncbi:MAG TPA: YidB family protein [Vicinamibacterales bacterium]|jgi:uncharacterized protein YidB (DUF937 family)
MGLLDGILSNVVGSLGSGAMPGAQNPLGALLGGLGGGQGQGANLLTAAMSLLQQNGGLDGVLDSFRQNGMAQHADSWVSTGANVGISGDQLQQVLGSSSIGNVASQLNMSHGQASSALAQILPELINQLTPGGQVPSNHSDLISQGLAMLTGRGA